MKTITIMAAALFMSLIAQADNNTPTIGVLKIKVSNIENASGTLYIAISNSADGWMKSDADSEPFRDTTQAVTGTDDVLVSIAELPPGSYAISLFQDLNGNAELDTNFVGYPKEPFGFSAPMGSFGPPSFEEAAIEFSGENTGVEVELN